MKEKHTKNNYSAANTACNPLKPHEGWAILAQLRGINPLLSRRFTGITHHISSSSVFFFSLLPHNHSLGDDTEKPQDNFKYSHELSSIYGLKPQTIFTLVRKAGLLRVRAKQGGNIYLYIFIIKRGQSQCIKVTIRAGM